MKYLSIDIEATGLREKDLIIEFAAVPFDLKDQSIAHELGYHTLVKCPPFKELMPTLDEWVIKNNKDLITKAHKEGVETEIFKQELISYLKSSEILDYFKDSAKEKIILFGKSMNAIDLPFLNRDIGWDTMRELFHHQVLDLSSVVMSMVDNKLIPPECLSGSELMNYLKLGDVCHTAMEDAVNTARMYLELSKIVGKDFS